MDQRNDFPTYPISFSKFIQNSFKKLNAESCRTDKVEKETIIKMIYSYINIQNGWAIYD